MCTRREAREDRGWLALWMPWLVCAGCAVGPDFHRPAAPNDRGYTPEGARETAVAEGKSQRFDEARPVSERLVADAPLPGARLARRPRPRWKPGPRVRARDPAEDPGQPARRLRGVLPAGERGGLVQSSALQSRARHPSQQHLQPVHALRHRQLHRRSLGRRAPASRGAGRRRGCPALYRRGRVRHAHQQRRRRRSSRKRRMRTRSIPPSGSSPSYASRCESRRRRRPRGRFLTPTS